MKSNEILYVLLMQLSENDYSASEQAVMASTPTVSLAEKTTTSVNPTMAIVLVCLLCAFFMICVVSIYFRHYAERQLRLAASTTHGSETGSMRSVVRGLDPGVIATFATFTYSSVKGIKLGETVLECAVCLNEFQDHETLRLLPKCSHVFHRDCIDVWLASHVTCPVCRANLVFRPRELSCMTESLPDYSVDLEPDSSRSTEFLLPVQSKPEVPDRTTEMPRSYSTSHSVALQHVENIERYTLRLPHEARGRFMTSLPVSPHMVFPTETSEKMTFRSVSVGSTTRLDYVQYERSNPRRPGGETSRGGASVSYVATGGNDSSPASSSQQFFRSVRSPFNRLFPASNRKFDV